MDGQPSKRPGRPRKALAVPNAAAEGEGADHNDAGDREAGPVGTAAQAEPVRQGESWAGFYERVRHLAHAEPRLRNVWHPAPEQTMVVCANGNINVFEGPQRGQLNTGEYIDV